MTQSSHDRTFALADRQLALEIAWVEQDVDACFSGADPGIDRIRRYLRCLLAAARTGGSAEILDAARAEFRRIREQLDEVGGPTTAVALRV